MCFQLLDQLLALDVVWVGFERLRSKLEAFLELTELESKQASIEGGLEEVRAKAHRGVEVRLSLEVLQNALRTTCAERRQRLTHNDLCKLSTKRATMSKVLCAVMKS